MPRSSLPDSGPKQGDASPQARTCAECGVSSHERSLVGLKNDRRSDGPRWCVRCHPRFVGNEVARWLS